MTKLSLLRNRLMGFFWGDGEKGWRIYILALATALLSQSPLWAGFGFGVHGGVDFFTLDEQPALAFDLIDTSSVSIARGEISDPYSLGIHVFFDEIPTPIIDELDVSIDFSSKKYRFDFENPEYTGSGSQIDPQEVNYSRIGVAITVRHYLLSLPMEIETFRLYAGIGLGMQMISPIVGRDLIYDNLYDSDTRLNLKQQGILDKASKAAFIGLLGIRISPPMLPLSFRAEARYFSMGEWLYGQPENFYSVSAGVSYLMQ